MGFFPKRDATPGRGFGGKRSLSKKVDGRGFSTSAVFYFYTR